VRRGGLRDSGLLLAAAVALSCGSKTSTCTPVSGGATPFATLDQWCQVSLVNDDISPMAGVTPYTLNTPLFSDYAVKRRTVYVPSGGSATYDATNVFDFPDGTVLTKSFGFADDMRKAQPILTWVETRVIWKNAGTWQGVSYTWDAAQKVASVNPGGEVVPLTWIDANGQTVNTNYLVPSEPQCAQCHDSSLTFEPIGPKARNLNGNETYPDGTTQNQLTYWSAIGLLTGAPDPSVAPKLAVWNDPTTGTLDQRARAYLESNCAHCHSLTGESGYTGLLLSTSITDPISYGVCKKPVAAGAGGGGFTYDIVPGAPGSSIIPFRMNSTEPSIAMPQIERSVVDVEGLQLITDWIASLPGTCT
jgi:uncharacterized repeat protein (TIGR03806 family)